MEYFTTTKWELILTQVQQRLEQILLHRSKFIFIIFSYDVDKNNKFNFKNHIELEAIENAQVAYCKCCSKRRIKSLNTHYTLTDFNNFNGIVIIIYM